MAVINVMMKSNSDWLGREGMAASSKTRKLSDHISAVPRKQKARTRSGAKLYTL